MNISLPQFTQNLDCQLCDLWGGSTHVGIPARRVGSGPLKETAILAVGERPGAEEDRLNATLVGKAGLWFEKIYLKATKLNTLADVYVTNAVRCKPPKDATITKSQFKACNGYLIADLQELRTHYKTVLILGLGAGAARTLRDSSLEDAYYHQGDKVTVGDHQYVTFWTTNPANLFADRNPSMATAVADHLEMVRDFLTHGRVPLIDDISAYTVERAPSDPGKTDLLSLDIESYGAVKGLPNQTVFQATRAMVTDKCPRDQLVQTVAVAWRDDGRTRIATWNVQRDTEAHAFSVFMRTYYQRGGRAILGMNTQFDIGFLRAWNMLGGWKKERYDLLDLGIINYLHSEVRPERSLKNLSLILRSADYSDELNLKAGERYESADDPKLHLYNAKDALATLVNYDRLSFAIRRDYPDSPKLSPYCLDWYNRLLWFAVEASESGVTFDREQLIGVDRRMTLRAERIAKIIRAKGGTIEGEGANKWKKSFVEAALVEAGLVGDRRVHRTPKTKAVSFGEENLNLLAGCLTPHSDSARLIRLWQQFITARDICGRYTKPLLLGRKRTKSSPYNKKSIVLESGQAHPTWYVVPSLFENQSGGTKQGRITCLAGDTRVISSEGDLTLKEVVQRKLDVATFDASTGLVRFTTPTAWFSGGPQDLYKITYKGRNTVTSVLATGEHQWLLKNGTRATTADLRKGTSLRHVYRYIDHHGYIRLRTRDRKWGEHIWTLHTLNVPGHEEVHHKNGIRTDYARSNLQGMTIHEHRKLTGQGRKKYKYWNCENCSVPCEKNHTRTASFRFCSRECWYEFRRNNYRVISVEPAGNDEVFCLTIPETHTFLLADGLVSGNCLNPGLLNLAKPVKKCLGTRFTPGILIEADLSQIELRTGALLSGDPAMLDYYRKKIDYHTETGKLVLRELLNYMLERDLSDAFGVERSWIEAGFRDGLFVKSNKQFEVWRFLGKTLNFLVLFKGGAKKAQETACRDLGVLLPIEVWQRIIAAFDERHPTFRAWQSEWLTKTIKTGYAMLPLIGQSRLFAGGRSAGENVINEIANFPIQTQAANTLIDGAWQARLDFQREGLKACIGLYIYDAVYVEAPAEEEARVTEILKDRLVNVDYWNRLSAHVGHSCPIEVDVKVIRRTNG